MEKARAGAKSKLRSRLEGAIALADKIEEEKGTLSLEGTFRYLTNLDRLLINTKGLYARIRGNTLFMELKEGGEGLLELGALLELRRLEGEGGERRVRGALCFTPPQSPSRDR